MTSSAEFAVLTPEVLVAALQRLTAAEVAEPVAGGEVVVRASGSVLRRETPGQVVVSERAERVRAGVWARRVPYLATAATAATGPWAGRCVTWSPLPTARWWRG